MRQWVPENQHKARDKEDLTGVVHPKVTTVPPQHPVKEKKADSSSNMFSSLSVMDRMRILMGVWWRMFTLPPLEVSQISLYNKL
jgi:hypothetical protein